MELLSILKESVIVLILSIIGLYAFYILVRLGSMAIFKSYFEVKRQERKKNHGL